MSSPAAPANTKARVLQLLSPVTSRRGSRLRSDVVNERYVRAGSRYVFPSAAASPVTKVMHPQSGFSLWSPARVTPKPIERHVPGLFSINDSNAEQQAPAPAPRPAEVIECCICLEEIENTPLTCSKCTMSAHPSCLCKWFGYDPSSHSACLPRSSATCPNCREKLDWDALALLHRRKAKSRRAQVLGSFVNKLASPRRERTGPVASGQENAPPTRPPAASSSRSSQVITIAGRRY